MRASEDLCIGAFSILIRGRPLVVRSPPVSLARFSSIAILSAAQIPVQTEFLVRTGTECAVAVANQVARRFVPGKRVGHLTSDPLGSQIVRRADADQSPSGVAKNYQAV